MNLVEAINLSREQQSDNLKESRLYIKSKFPVVINALQRVDEENLRPKRRKGYNLVVRESKKYGKRIYARLSYNGKTLPTKFNTYTDNETEAERTVLKNKERWIEGYLARKNGKMFKVLEDFYNERKGLSEQCRKDYKTVIKNKFIPFLKQEKINQLEKITKHTLIKFQDTLIKEGMQKKNSIKQAKPIKPQSVNRCFKAIKKVFNELERTGVISDDPCLFVKSLKVKEKDYNPRGCYELEKMSGIFHRQWKDELSYLLCSIIYTTGMRNSEIERIKMDDFIKKGGYWFVNIRESKTTAGVRMVPVHQTVYNKVKLWAEKNKKTNSELLFKVGHTLFAKANKDLAKRLKVNDEELKRENITFYSGRHFWLTLMRAEGLGKDIEKIWMGHSVSGNVTENYTHWNKIGKKREEEKIQKMINILDECFFKTKP